MDQLCSFYEQEYIQASTVTESYEALIHKVLQLANTNGLSSKGYESALSGFSAESMRGYLNKVGWPRYAYVYACSVYQYISYNNFKTKSCIG